MKIIPRKVAAATLLVSAAVVVLTSCSAEDDAVAEETPVSSASMTKEAAEPVEQHTPESDVEEAAGAEKPVADSIPVGDAFGEAVWSLSTDPASEVWARGDRLIVDDRSSGQIFAVDADGKRIWSFELPEDPNGLVVAVRRNTVAVLTGAEIEGDGLAETTYAAHVSLVSIADGTLVAENDLPLPSRSASLPSDLVSEGFYMTEDGVVHEFPDGYVTPLVTAGDRPFVDDVLMWGDSGGFGLVTETWRNDDYSFHDGLVDVPRGRILVQERTLPAPEGSLGSMLEVSNGQVLFDISCPEDVPRFRGASSSPSGEYIVSGPLWVSDSEGRCIGGGEGQQSVDLTAVADDGTAFGISEQGSLVVVPPAGEPEVTELPDGASSPFSVMIGDLALHRSGSTITANPIQ